MNTYKSLIATAMFVCVPLSVAAGDSYTVSTPKGTNVKVSVWGMTKPIIPDYTDWERFNMDWSFKKTYPLAILISSSTRKYNCHSYAWYSQSSSNNVWMPDPTSYMTDGSYAGYCMSTPPSGYKVYYPSNTPANSHSAISLGSGLAQSKWGQGPLMMHPIDGGPRGLFSEPLGGPKIYKMNCYYSYRKQ